MKEAWPRAQEAVCEGPAGAKVAGSVVAAPGWPCPRLVTTQELSSRAGYREHQAALSNRPSGFALRQGLNNLVLPGTELNLAPFRPRTMELGSTLPASCVVVSLLERDVRLELVADGDTLSAELRLATRSGARQR